MYETFRKLCDDRGVTPYRVSKDTGIGRSTFTDWKNGRCTPKIDKLQKIADYFGVSIEVFTGVQNNGQDEGYYIDGETARIAQAIFENKELRLLFDEMADAEPSTIKATHELLLTLKRKENGEYD